jgi:hypothetical protein
MPPLPLLLTATLTPTGPALIQCSTSLHPPIAIPSNSTNTSTTTTTTTITTTTTGANARRSITRSLTLPPFRALGVTCGAHVSYHIRPHLPHYVGTLLRDNAGEHSDIETHVKKKKKKKKRENTE